MNGTLSKSGQSVWSVLDKLRAQLPGQSSSSSTPATAQGDAKAAEERVLDDDDSGVMIYGPLLPNDSSEVELARSTDVDEAEAGKAEESAPSARPDPLGSLKGKLEEMWPFKAKEDGKRTVDNDAAPSTSRVHFQPVQPGKPKRVWIPSPDKISIQVMWWGYRM
ncbi:uncharacterized protein PHACADRAFT_167516 [Phanerochaete carnosa HHB-10118-sp]|uniref:Uncharacterized protein n=1 Tax=Phanerochaete carnosa (strain HHB-10118-sp) TaxID=650164 RepID=K5WE25_PHACS|nr:uncharacterized protein PHACADRAFT_167516 [Phanerochaete carnosa HHB-10118-sp]EKM48407.1 hypothetical protein PHACADRAFT_167516 [Phanerochaete carnosa HHB-10118-sp]